HGLRLVVGLLQLLLIRQAVGESLADFQGGPAAGIDEQCVDAGAAGAGEQPELAGTGAPRRGRGAPRAPPTPPTPPATPHPTHHHDPRPCGAPAPRRYSISPPASPPPRLSSSLFSPAISARSSPAPPPRGRPSRSPPPSPQHKGAGPGPTRPPPPARSRSARR